MKKLLPAVIIILIIIAALFAYMKSGGIKKEIVIPGSEIKKEEGQSGETFTGKLKEAIARGVPMKCTFNNQRMEGTAYVKGKNYYAEISDNQRAGHLIIRDNCMWTWDQEKNQGVKWCMEKTDTGGDIWDMPNQGGTTEGEYICNPAVFPDTYFTPPDTVNFLDMEQQFGIEGNGQDNDGE